MATFILIHGAWHGGWCWERVVPLLELGGHRALAPDLPAMGEDPTPAEEATLERWAAFTADLARDQDEPVVLVGHSRGGIVVSQAAELAPEAVAGLVYLAAFLVPHAGTLMEVAATIPSPALAAAVVVAPDGLSATVDPAAVGPGFYQTTEPAWTERAAGRLVREPTACFTTPLQLTPERFGRVPRAYIETAQDRALLPALQQAMREALPCEPVIVLDTDHSPFYSAAEALAEALATCAAAFVSRCRS